MKSLFRFALFAGILFALYWFALRDGCGTKGAIACPDPALEEGVGQTLVADEVCPYSGYLCAEGRNFQVARWENTKGRLRVRVTLPEFLQGEVAEQARAAAIEGIRTWEGHPFPLVIVTGGIPLRGWDINVVWTEGLFNGAAGLNRWEWRPNGKRIDYSVTGLSVVVPPGLARDDAGLARVREVAIHEMGHALGLRHSDLESDIMFPRLRPDVSWQQPSKRDFQTVDALYELPNGATVR